MIQKQITDVLMLEITYQIQLIAAISNNHDLFSYHLSLLFSWSLHIANISNNHTSVLADRYE
jgi:hypothetical protein